MYDLMDYYINERKRQQYEREAQREQRAKDVRRKLKRQRDR